MQTPPTRMLIMCVLWLVVVPAVLSLSADHHHEVPTGASRTTDICAIGDLHGDANHAHAALRLCGVVAEDSWTWTGGSATVVQTGDVVDRGNASLPLLRHLWALREQASAAGGELLLLLGNHELLNMQGATHYVDAGELQAFGGVAAWRRAMDPRTGEIGKQLAALPGAAVRGGGPCRTLFLHAGLRLRVGQETGGTVDALNEALRHQVEQNHGALLDARQGPLWFRGYARPAHAGLTEDEACAELRASLASFGDGAKQMAVGHNIVPFVATRCAKALYMIDVGMSEAYGGRPAAWRCSVEAHDGHARVRALYLEGDEEPPDLCDACADIRRKPHPLRGSDEHSDCRNYCKLMPGRRGSSSSTFFSSLLGGSGGTGEQHDPAAAPSILEKATNSAQLKTEF